MPICDPSPLHEGEPEFLEAFNQYRRHNAPSNMASSADEVRTNEIEEDSKELGTGS